MKKNLSKIILKYLRLLTRSYLLKNNISIVGLTGSAGKSTLTLAINTILSTKFNTGMTYQKGHGLNSETGIPFAVLNVHLNGYGVIDWVIYIFKATINYFFSKSNYEIFIAEMGVDKPDDMSFLLSMLPNIKLGIFLNVSAVHGANFEDLLPDQERDNNSIMKLIFEEKAKLIRSLPEGSFAILNNDDELIRELKSETKAHSFTFGLNSTADLQGRIKEVSAEKFVGEVIFAGQSEEVIIDKYFFNSKNFTTLLAGILSGLKLGLSLKECAKAISNIELPPGRMSRIDGIRGTTIIDSTYNASTDAVMEALDTLALFSKRKKIAVLGDMRELGVASQIEHESIARKTITVADEIILVGPQMQKYFLPEALKNNFPSERIRSFENTYKALEYLRDTMIAGGEAILVKGSQNTLLMEIIVEGIMKEPELASKLLCRRGEYWDGRREALRPVD